MDAAPPKKLSALCLDWLREHDQWVEIDDVAIGVGNPSKESVRHALENLTITGRAIKRVPKPRRAGMRVTYRLRSLDTAGECELALAWGHPIKKRPDPSL
jgi:hypothetical protein